jgi:hypothetical protein
MVSHQETASFADDRPFDRAFEHELPVIVAEHLPEILGAEAGLVRLASVSVSAPFLVNDDRHHRVARIRYEGESGERRLSVWLKFRPGLEASFENHRLAWAAMDRDRSFLPRPYFFHRSEDKAVCVVGLEHVPGITMRRAVLLGALTNDRERLGALFCAFGARLRSFHDALATPTGRNVAAIVGRLTEAIAAASCLEDDERARAIANVERAGDVVGRDTDLQLTRSHNDLTMRNVILRPDGSITVVDCDSLQRPGETRWHDVAHFLLNLGSVVRYYPLFRPAFVARLSAAFLAGYRGQGYPGRLSEARMHAVLRLIKAEYMLGIGFRPPFLVTYDKVVGRRFYKQLKRDLLEDWRPSSNGTANA